MDTQIIETNYDFNNLLFYTIKTMRTIQIKLPESVEMQDYDFLLAVASKLYLDCKLTLGQASQVAGVSKRTFIELLGKYGVSVFSEKLTDFKSDFENA